MLKIVGQATALSRAYYPTESGHCRIVEAGETFDLVEGHTDGKWFVSNDPVAAETPAPRRRKQADPAPDADTLA